MKKLIIGTVAVGVLGLAACSSSESSTAASTTTAAGSSSSGAGSSSDAGTGSDSGSDSGSTAADRDLCAEVTAEDVQALTGETITSAKPLSGGSHFSSSFQGASCVYTTSTGLGGVSAEFVDAGSYDALTTDPVTKPQPLDGVGDEAFQGVDQIDGTKVIRTIAKKGDEYLFVQIYAGTSEANAKTLTEQLLG